MLEIWCLLQWAWRPGRPCFPCQAEGWWSGGGSWWFGLSAKLTVLLLESHWSLSTTGLAEAFITEEDNAPRVRRLHLMAVDLHRRRRMADRVLRLLVDIQIDRCADECWNILPIPWKQNQEAYQLRDVFGYAMDGSDLPCYILWPSRTAEQSFWCIDAWKGDWVRLDKCSFMAPLGIEDFFNAFCFEPQRPWQAAACQALDIPSCHGSNDTYLEQGQESQFSLTPRRIPVERKTPAA